MKFEEFKESMAGENPPTSLSQELKGLWWDGKKNWDKSHETVQDLETKEAAWVHAYLHRKEGDIGNADYWYRRAGKVRPNTSLEEEWTGIVQQMLE